MEIFTIGHSNLSSEEFIGLLKKHEITAVADVRSHPYSRYLPHFNQSPLKAALLKANIDYVFLGRELGARPADINCYINGKAVYEKIAATELFSEGIQRLIKGAKKYKIALMCAEQDPITCHRTILVCQNLRQFNLEISHILKNGSLETHQHLEDRLLILQGLDIDNTAPKQLSLFGEPELNETRPKSERLQQAYRLQGEQIAYVEKGSEDE